MLIVGLAAAATVHFAFGSVAIHRARYFVAMLSVWPSTESANLMTKIFADGLLTALISGTHTTILVLWLRMSAVSAAAFLSATVFVVASPWAFFLAINGEIDTFVEGHITLAVVFFLTGWLIASFVSNFVQRQRNKKNQA